MSAPARKGARELGIIPGILPAGKWNSITEARGIENDRILPLFQSAIESTEEAIYNSLCMTETMTGTGGVTIPALPFSVVEKYILHHNKENS
jgi:L-aminopeptidase/D-esterase-like protein